MVRSLFCRQYPCELQITAQAVPAQLTVKISGVVDSESGMICSLPDLDKLVGQALLATSGAFVCSDVFATHGCLAAVEAFLFPFFSSPNLAAGPQPKLAAGSQPKLDTLLLNFASPWLPLASFQIEKRLAQPSVFFEQWTHTLLWQRHAKALRISEKIHPEMSFDQLSQEKIFPESCRDLQDLLQQLQDLQWRGRVQAHVALAESAQGAVALPFLLERD